MKTLFKGLAELEAKELLDQITTENYYRLNFFFMLADLHKKDLSLFHKLKKFMNEVTRTRQNIAAKIQRADEKKHKADSKIMFLENGGTE